MCTVSMVGDEYTKRFPKRYPWFPTTPQIPVNPAAAPATLPTSEFYPTRAEFEALKKDFEALKQFLIAAKVYDEATGQKDCEMDEKIALLRR